MEEGITYVGLDAHQESTNGAIILTSGEVVEDRFATTPDGIRRWARRLKRRCQGRIVCCYEAGPLGYALQRTLVSLKIAKPAAFRRLTVSLSSPGTTSAMNRLPPVVGIPAIAAPRSFIR